MNKMKTTTEHRCPECTAFCSESFDNAWLVCPRCSRTSHDFKPPDLYLSRDWDFPTVDGVELADSLGPSSITEHAWENWTAFPRR